MIFIGNQGCWMETNCTWWKSIIMHENQWYLMDINFTCWKSMILHEAKNIRIIYQFMSYYWLRARTCFWYLYVRVYVYIYIHVWLVYSEAPTRVVINNTNFRRLSMVILHDENIDYGVEMGLSRNGQGLSWGWSGVGLGLMRGRLRSFGE